MKLNKFQNTSICQDKGKHFKNHVQLLGRKSSLVERDEEISIQPKSHFGIKYNIQ